GPRQQEVGLLRLLGGGGLVLLALPAGLGLFLLQRRPRLAQLGHGRFHHRLALVVAVPLLLGQLAVGGGLGAQPVGLLKALPQVGLAGLLQGALVAQRLLLATHLLAYPLQLAAQRRQHCLLAFQGAGALLDLPGEGLLFLFLLGQALGFGAQAVVPFVHLRRLVLQVAAVALHLLEALVDLQGAPFQLPLLLLDGRLDAVQAHQIGLVLLLRALQRLPALGQGGLALLQVGDALRHLALRLLVAAGQQAMLLLDQLPFALHLLARRLVLRDAQVPFV